MLDLKIIKREEQKLALYKKEGFSISVTDAVNGTTLFGNPCRQEYTIMIGKALSSLFFMHGKQFTPDMIKMFLNSIIDTYQYETPETILLFLKKAANGDFGKFYGEPDIGTIREWFATYLGQTIIPAREHERTRDKERYDNQREQGQSLREYIQGSGKSRG